MEPLIHLNYNIDTDQLLNEASVAQQNAKAHTDSRYPDIVFDEWLIGHHTSPYIEKIMADLEIDGRPRFYWLKPHAVIPEHVDNGTQCSINIVLTDNAAPIIFGDKEYVYRTVLLNTTVPHSVKNNEHERIMLKISIFDETYEQLAKRIKFKA